MRDDHSWRFQVSCDLVCLHFLLLAKYSATASGSIWTVLFKIEVPVDYAHTVLSVRAVDEQNANEISTDAQCIDDSVELVVSGKLIFINDDNKYTVNLQ